MSEVAEITSAYAEGFDAEREVLIGANAKLLMLDVSHTILETVTTGWSAEFSEFFGSTTFKVARADEAFNDKVGEASFLVVTDSDNAALNRQLHTINRETTVPAGIDPYWRIRGNAKGERYQG